MSRDIRLAKLIRAKLGERAAQQFQSSVGADGEFSLRSNGELFIEMLMNKALEGKEWAARAILEYIEGKPATSVRNEDADRSTEQRLRDLTIEHLNTITASITGDPAAAPERPDPVNDEADGVDGAPPAGGNGRAGKTASTSPLLALPKNRAGDSKDRDR